MGYLKIFSRVTLLFAVWLGLNPVGFGINCILRPEHAYTFFEFDLPADHDLLDSMMRLQGARNIYIGLMILTCAFIGSRTTLGLSLLFFSAVAVADGLVCQSYGRGQQNHFGYAPIVVVNGLIQLALGQYERKSSK